MEGSRSDSYSTFAQKAAKKCRLPTEVNKELSLFKLNGARILDECIHVKSRSGKISVRSWTLGNYFLLMKKSLSVCKIGVAYAHSLEESTTSMSENSSDKHKEDGPDELVSTSKVVFGWSWQLVK